LWADSQIEPLARITEFIKEQGAVPGIQLAHAGRKGSCTRPWEGDRSLTDAEDRWETIAPSAIAFGEKIWHVPRAMTSQDIRDVQEAFEKATVRALQAGFQWLELHAAHGYLCHSFYSPLSNHRTDAYGGTFDNRVRFTVETLERIRRVWPESLPLSVRLSCSDWVEGGWTLQDSIELSKRLKSAGADLIDCSSGFNTPDHRIYPFGPGWQVPFAEQIRKNASIPTMAVGLITDPVQADEIVKSQKADIVLLARELLRDPYWPYRAAQVLGFKDRATPPSQYLRAI
jgi:2,4-dienoyl-CoA reductase-like NADH-dependent reductase (Old Yellow Enzyme family)